MATFEEAQYDFIRNSPSGERHISEVGAFNSGFRAGAASRDVKVEEAQAQLERATDLVRYARHFLHEEELISDEEYAAIVQGNAGELAQRIQDVIEEFIQEKNAAPVQVHPGKTILSSDGWE